MLTLMSLMLACGGEEKKVETPAAVAPPVAAPPVAPPPVAAPPAAAAGAYTPDSFAKAAYDAAIAAGADKVTANPKSGDATAIAAGKAQWVKCLACHGDTGHGDGIAGAALPQKPGNFHDKARWDFTNAGIKHWVIQNGVKGTAMAPLGLTPDQSWEVLAFIEAEFVGKP